MTRGLSPCLPRRRFMLSHCDGASAYGLHCLGLDENTCKVLQPRRHARSAAFSTPPATDVWMPIRRAVSHGGAFGAGILRMSCSRAMERGIAFSAQWRVASLLRMRRLGGRVRESSFAPRSRTRVDWMFSEGHPCS